MEGEENVAAIYADFGGKIHLTAARADVNPLRIDVFYPSVSWDSPWGSVLETGGRFETLSRYLLNGQQPLGGTLGDDRGDGGTLAGRNTHYRL